MTPAGCISNCGIGFHPLTLLCKYRIPGIKTVTALIILAANISSCTCNFFCLMARLQYFLLVDFY